MNPKASTRTVLTAAAALAALTMASSAHARDRVDVQWQVTVGNAGVVLPLPPLPPLPRIVVRPADPPRQAHYPSYPVHQPAPYPASHPGYGYGDRDRDGIPNRHDRTYNPRWEVDGDGIPNRHDRVYNPRWDRDGDGVPNRYDRTPDGYPSYYHRQHDGRGWRGERDDRKYRNDDRDDRDERDYRGGGRRP